MAFFDSMPWIVSSALIVIPCILVCLVILFMIRKWIPTHQLKENHDVAGFILGIVGVLYSVILGFTVVNVQTRYNVVLQTVHTEAVAIADLYRDATFFPSSDRDAIRTNLRNYVNYVVNHEWGHATSKEISIPAQKIMEKIWISYYNIDLQNEKMNIWYSATISKLDDFMNARLARQFSAWEHLGSMMWTILIVGGIITVGFMYFFGLENLRSQMVMTALLAGYISFMLFLVYSLDHAFMGSEGIKPIALEKVQNLFDHWDNSIR
jgi:amino acid transporter